MGKGLRRWAVGRWVGCTESKSWRASLALQRGPLALLRIRMLKSPRSDQNSNKLSEIIISQKKPHRDPPPKDAVVRVYHGRPYLFDTSASFVKSSGVKNMLSTALLTLLLLFSCSAAAFQATRIRPSRQPVTRTLTSLSGEKGDHPSAKCP